MKKALEMLKACRERGQKRAGGLDINEAIAELEEAMKKSNECDALQNAIDSLEAQIKNQTINEYMIQEAIKETFKQFVVQSLVKDRLISRKIVAMLFWEWKETDRLSKTYADYDYLPKRTARKDEAYYCFNKAYKMLKDNR